VLLAGATSLSLATQHGDHSLGAGSSFPTRLPEYIAWVLMVVAMMFPPMAGNLKVVADRSRWARRDVALGEFLFGFLAIWAICGLGVIALERGLPRLLSMSEVWLGPAGFGVAAAWQLSTSRRRMVRACHLTVPLPPCGWRADARCITYGMSIGMRCVASCWAVMLACHLSGHAIVPLSSAAYVAFAERTGRVGSSALSAVLGFAGLALLVVQIAASTEVLWVADVDAFIARQLLADDFIAQFGRELASGTGALLQLARVAGS
jgi:predicted metal-binding membrane protein